LHSSRESVEYASLDNVILSVVYGVTKVGCLLKGIPVMARLRNCVLLALFWASGLCAAQDLPSFCAAVDPALLSGLEAPYSRHLTPDGTPYCEGLLPRPIAIVPPRIISVKQDQSPTATFEARATAVLTWLSGPKQKESAQIKLRSFKTPLFALDAAAAGSRFEWSSTLISRLQPEWRDIAALVTRQVPIAARMLPVVDPVRQGTGCSESYTFVVQSFSTVHLTTALLEPVDGAKPFAINISSKAGPTPNTWEITIPFSKRPNGIFRISLSENVGQSGAATEPMYLFVGACDGPATHSEK
jgi:hypothetical protein